MRSTVEIAPAGSRPAIRLRPVPRFEPPFDDESAPQVWAPSRQLALEWPANSRPAPVPPVESPPVAAGASGDAKLAVRRFVRLCVEVLNGFRPAAHLRRLSLPAGAADVVAQGLAGARRAADLRRAAEQRATRRPGAGQQRRAAPVAVLGLKICEPRVGAVEAAVTLVTGERTWAIAFRLELHQQTWAATTLLII
ncbi:Rv3235 family protein [Actinoplanes sp. NEAU-A12]|uniref:Rv3235 family protein n=1 Tax=Actinoplanes sandaracinus TaxID=3045177 RepID=A0ABT6X023_9ACTN|nr:Rv3235 family protein [Actinoplanes sandaracinus]MDI6105344.1 Rv3235 family protein [Actinoplanes sandaracinus]